MAKYFCISVTFLDDYYHGKRTGNQAEWPPSPWRLFQAILAGCLVGCRKNGWPDDRTHALRWLENLPPPEIRAPQRHRCTSYTFFVPNNDADKPAARQLLLTSKLSFPQRLLDSRTIHYGWRLTSTALEEARQHLETLCQAARNILALGWGIDQAVAEGRLLEEDEFAQLPGELWKPWPERQVENAMLRVPKPGALDDLQKCYQSFLNSFAEGGWFRPRRESRCYQEVAYFTKPPRRLYTFFDLRRQDGQWAVFRQLDIVKVAAMLRHLACEEARRDPIQFPGGSEVFVAGHAQGRQDSFPRFSYLPLPTIGHAHADGLIRRALIAEPVGGEGRFTSWASWKLTNRRLIDDSGKPRAWLRKGKESDSVLKYYVGKSKVWASVTPVILPGFDDGKYNKALRLVKKALRQAEITLQSVDDVILKKAPYWPGAEGPAAYFRPDYLQNYPAWHIVIFFREEVEGPISVGAGRHCGLGLLAHRD